MKDAKTETSILDKGDLKMNSKSMILYDKYQCEQLEDQFVTMFHIQLDDFESNLQHMIRKKEIVAVVEGQVEDSSVGMSDMFDSEMKQFSLDFYARIEKLMEEFFLLKKHIAALDLQHDALNHPSILPSIESTTNIGAKQYAALVYYSTDEGTTYEKYDEIPYCRPCGGPVFKG